MNLQEVKKTSKTTIYGILTFIALVLNEVSTFFDADPLTNPNWAMIIPALLILLGFGAAKDAKSKAE